MLRGAGPGLLALALLAGLTGGASGADRPVAWGELERGRSAAVATRAAALRDSWARTHAQESLDAYLTLVRDLRAYPQPTPADRALCATLAGDFLAQPAPSPGTEPPLIRARMRLVDELLTEDGWTAAQAPGERRLIGLHLLSLTLPTIKAVAESWLPGWTAPRLHDPRAGAVFGAEPRVVDPATVQAYEAALLAGSRQRAWNDAAQMLRAALPEAAERMRGGSTPADVAALLIAAGAAAPAADAWSTLFSAPQAPGP